MSFEGWSRREKNSERWGWDMQVKCAREKIGEREGRRRTDFIDILKELLWWYSTVARCVYLNFETDQDAGAKAALSKGWQAGGGQGRAGTGLEGKRAEGRGSRVEKWQREVRVRRPQRAAR